MKKRRDSINSNVFLLLRWFCPAELLEEIEGDLLQKFERDIKALAHPEWPYEYKRRRAGRRLLWNVIRYFRPEILMRNKMVPQFSQLRLLSNYFKTTYRHAAKKK